MPEKDKAAAGSRREAALLFELETLGYGARQVTFDVLKSVLADKDITLTPIAFSRCCVDRSMHRAVPALLELLERPRLSAEKLVPDIVEGVRLSLSDNTPAPSDALKALLAKVIAKEAPIGAVSNMDQEPAMAMLEGLGLDETTAMLSANPADEASTLLPRTWNRLGRSLRALIPACVSVVTSAAACRAALESGTRCVVITDKYTSFQDFGGADAVFETLDNEAAATILAMMDERP